MTKASGITVYLTKDGQASIKRLFGRGVRSYNPQGADLGRTQGAHYHGIMLMRAWALNGS